MKKLLILMLVLGMASLAHAVPVPAGSLIFTLNGEPQPEEIVLVPCQSVELDLELADGHNIGGAGFGYFLSYELTDTTAELLWEGTVFPTDMDLPGKYQNESARYGEITQSQIFNPAMPGPTVLMKGLMLHCLEQPSELDLVISVLGVTMIDGLEIDQGVVHTLHIRQIPEPMTIALLGLGSLFLMRRRRK